MQILKSDLWFNYSLFKGEEELFFFRKKNEPWYSVCYEGNIGVDVFQIKPQNIWRPFKINEVFKNHSLYGEISYRKKEFKISIPHELSSKFRLLVTRRVFNRPNFILLDSSNHVIFEINAKGFSRNYIVEKIDESKIHININELIAICGFCVINNQRMAQHGYY